MRVNKLKTEKKLKLTAEQRSLWLLYDEEENIEQKLQIATDLANKYIHNNYLFSIKVCKNALEIARQNHFNKQATLFILKIAEIYNTHNKTKEAINYMEDTILEYYNGKLSVEAHSVLHGLAQTYQNNGQIVAAFTTFIEAIKEAFRARHNFDGANIVVNLAITTSLTGNNKLAYQLFSLSEKFYNEYAIENKLEEITKEKFAQNRLFYQNQSFNYCNIINVCLLANFQEVLEEFAYKNKLEKVEIINKKYLKSAFFDAVIYALKHSICKKNNDFDKADFYLKEAKSTFDKIEGVNTMAILSESIAKYNFLKGNVKEAIQILYKYFGGSNYQNIDMNKTIDLKIFKDLIHYLIVAQKEAAAIFILEKLIKSAEANKNRLHLAYFAYHKLAEINADLIDENKFLKCVNDYKEFYKPILEFDIKSIEKLY